MKIFEAVPNFSEGRDPAKIERLALAARSVTGVTVLDVESDRAHHRSVISIAGEGSPVSEALFRMIRVAVETIDLNHHRGEHPRMGAVDVVPFVPFGESTVEEAVALSIALGHRVYQELGVPVYLYGSAARTPERADLAHLRRGEFEGIRAEIATNPERRPDIGEPKVHPTAGIVAIGARPVLIAYNAYLATPEVTVAKSIAHAIRERDGGLPAVKALGFEIPDPPRAQVSMNLTDYRRTPVHTALEAVRAEAIKRGTSVTSSEIVGLVPEGALLDAAEHYLALAGFDRERILERRLRAAEPAPVREAPAALSALTVAELAGKVAARTPTPGGGSVAAVAGALGTGLLEMAIRYSTPTGTADPEFSEALATLETGRARFLALIDEDSAAYEEVRAARKARKVTPEDVEARQRLRAALRNAAAVPLETARWARDAADLGERVRGRIKAVILSDLETGLALLSAARSGAAANVRVNLQDLAAEGIDVRGLEAEIAQITGETP